MILPEVVSIDVDKMRIEQVITNLLSNAIKNTPKKGIIKIQLEEKGDIVYFKIKDTGIGIPPERLAEIFEPFHQLDSSSTRRHGGTGLGLALVIRILEAHGAFPRVQSEVGTGTLLEFTLPFVKNHLGTTQRT